MHDYMIELIHKCMTEYTKLFDTKFMMGNLNKEQNTEFVTEI